MQSPPLQILDLKLFTCKFVLVFMYKIRSVNLVSVRLCFSKDVMARVHPHCYTFYMAYLKIKEDFIWYKILKHLWASISCCYRNKVGDSFFIQWWRQEKNNNQNNTCFWNGIYDIFLTSLFSLNKYFGKDKINVLCTFCRYQQ